MIFGILNWICNLQMVFFYWEQNTQCDTVKVSCSALVVTYVWWHDMFWWFWMRCKKQRNQQWWRLAQNQQRGINELWSFWICFVYSGECMINDLGNCLTVRKLFSFVFTAWYMWSDCLEGSLYLTKPRKNTSSVAGSLFCFPVFSYTGNLHQW